MDVTLIKTLLANLSTPLGKYTYVRVVKGIAEGVALQFNISPAILGTDMKNIAAGADPTTLQAADAEAMQSLVELIDGFLVLYGLTGLTTEDLKTLFGVWGPRLETDFAVTTA